MRPSRLSPLLLLLGIAAAGPAIAGPIDDLQPGQWYEVPNSHLRSVVPVPTPPGSPTAIMTAWSGGTFDPNRNRLLVWGGGHGDYGGNEIYAFDINTLTWSRIWGPTDVSLIPWPPPTCADTYADGNPVSRHTYDGLTFLPVQDRFWIYGGSRYCGSGGGGMDTWTFDQTGGHWERRADGPGRFLVTSAYDPVTRHVFMNDESYCLYEYDPVGNSWQEYCNAGGTGLDKNAEIDPVRRKYVAVGNGEIGIYNLAQSPPTLQWPTTTGATEIMSTRFTGLAYDPVSDRMVAWSGGPYVYTLNLDTLVWTRHSPTNSVVPGPAADKGTHGRWQYIPSKNAFIGVSDIDENVFIYKLAAGGGTPSDSTPPSAPANLQPR